MRTRTIFCLGALGWLFTVYGCGGDSTPSGSAGNGTGGGAGSVQPGTGPVALDSLAREMTITMCNLMARCFSPALLTGYSAAECVADNENAAADQTIAQLRAAITAGHAVYDPAAMRGCLDAYAGLSCDYVNESDVVSACANAMQGTVPVGGECVSQIECADNLATTYCASTGTCPGQCAARGGPGATCSDDVGCLLTLACDSDSSTCKTRLKSGDACSETGGTGVCGGLTSCEPDPSTGAASCVTLGSGTAALAEGQTCGGSGPCATDLICTMAPGDGGASSYTCQKRAASGGPCHFALGNPCPDAEYCPVPLAEASTGSGTCTPRLGLNQPCDDTILLQCQDGLVCGSGGTCMAKQRIGGSCGENDECYSSHCTGGVCVVPQDCAD